MTKKISTSFPPTIIDPLPLEDTDNIIISALDVVAIERKKECLIVNTTINNLPVEVLLTFKNEQQAEKRLQEIKIGRRGE